MSPIHPVSNTISEVIHCVKCHINQWEIVPLSCLWISTLVNSLTHQVIHWYDMWSCFPLTGNSPLQIHVTAITCFHRSHVIIFVERTNQSYRSLWLMSASLKSYQIGLRLSALRETYKYTTPCFLLYAWWLVISSLTFPIHCQTKDILRQF